MGMGNIMQQNDGFHEFVYLIVVMVLSFGEFDSNVFHYMM
jgi:hypothetical protein